MCVIHSIFLLLSLYLSFCRTVLFFNLYLIRCRIRNFSGIIDSAVRTFLLCIRDLLFGSRASSTGLYGLYGPPRVRTQAASPPRSCRLKLFSFSSRRRHHRLRLHRRLFARSPKITTELWRRHTKSYSRKRALLILYTTIHLSAKVALPTKRDFNYYAIGLASGSLDI